MTTWRDRLFGMFLMVLLLAGTIMMSECIFRLGQVKGRIDAIQEGR
jgi:hypothetical protein